MISLSSAPQFFKENKLMLTCSSMFPFKDKMGIITQLGDPSPCFSCSPLLNNPHPYGIMLGSIQCFTSWGLVRLSRSGSCTLLFALYSLKQISKEHMIVMSPAASITGPSMYNNTLMKVLKIPAAPPAANLYSPNQT